MSDIQIDGATLTLEQVARVARGGARVGLSAQASERVARARALVEAHAAGDEAIYGVNTGFGFLKNVRIPASDLAQLQVNLIRSHAVGVGPALGSAETRALMLLRANAMATGRSGISLGALSLLLELLNRGVEPVVPAKGSVGASGDLAPLAHLALVLIGEGQARIGGSVLSGSEALARAGLSPIRLGAKEGLCLVNGTQAMAALGCLAILDAESLALHADLAGAASLEGRRGTATAFDPRIHAARPHEGQRASAEILRRLVADSEIAASHADCDAVQDPYSFRCMPQVHGAVRDVLAFVRRTLSVEINSGTDNPLVFAEDGAMLSGGNFHGQPVAFALDFLAIAVSELAAISDRRVSQLIDPSLSKLPAFLVEKSGLNSGFMMAQVTAASLINENRVLSTPATTGSIPTSANQEDHVSMGMTAARKAAEVVSNTRACLAVELLCACQAVDLIGLRPGKGVEAVWRAVRAKVPKLVEDRALHADVTAVDALIKDGSLVDAAETAVGPLC